MTSGWQKQTGQQPSTILTAGAAFLAASALLAAGARAAVDPAPRGPYLGQSPPGSTARLFAPGILSTGAVEILAVVSPDGREIYATRLVAGRGLTTLVWRQSADGTWSDGETASFSGRWQDFAVSFSPDGRRLWLVSTRPITAGGPPQSNQDIWFVERDAAGKWSDPVHPGPPINSDGRDLTPCDTGGALYFNRTPADEAKPRAIYRAAREGSSFKEPENLTSKIPLGFVAFEPAVPADERFMIFAGSGGPEDRGGFDLYVTFRSPSGDWSPPRNLGSGVNTPANEHFPTLSPDGRYLFFISDRDEKGAAVQADGTENPDIYWISTEVVEALRPAKITPAAEIHEAVRGGDLARVRALVEKDARTIDEADLEGETPLHVALWERRVEIAAFLLDRGARHDLKNGDDQTPLFYAAFKGPADLAGRLLAGGADLRRRDRGGRSPLHYAAREGQPDVVDLLIRNGADIDAKDGQGDTPLAMAASRGHVAAVEVLLARGADVNVQSRWRATPLLNAVRSDAPQVARLLLSHDADPKIGGNLGLTPLQAAARDGRIPLADLLLEAGAPVDGIDAGGNAALHWAVHAGHQEMVAFLIAKGADPGHLNARGRTALHEAASSGYRSIAALLLQAGAVADLRDRDGRTALDAAAAHGNRGVRDLLVQRDAAGRSRGKVAEPLKLLTRRPPHGAAVIWYLNHSGWAVRTRDHLLVFDPWDPSAAPDEPSVANGRLTPGELQGLRTLVLVSHEHRDHFDPKILEWGKAGAGVTYVFGWPREAPPGSVTFAGSLETARVGEATITNLRCGDGGSAFLVSVDGVTIYHSGDYTGDFRRDFAALAQKAGPVDVAFIETSEVYEEITLHTIERLGPRAMFPMHARGAEHWYGTWASRWSSRFPKTALVPASDRGDRWKYRGKIRALP